MKKISKMVGGAGAKHEGKLLSLFEPSTEVIRKGKAAKPNEFGKMVKLQEAENQIVIDYEVYPRRPNDSDLLIAAIETHQAMLGRAPHLVAADAAFYSTKNEGTAKKRLQLLMEWVSNASASPIAPPRAPSANASRRSVGSAMGRNGGPGCEGRISVVKRRHGLDRCRYKGDAGMQRWVGLGVIADNLINIGHAMEKHATP
jgi:transposase, IS5 family